MLSVSLILPSSSSTMSHLHRGKLVICPRGLVANLILFMPIYLPHATPQYLYTFSNLFILSPFFHRCKYVPRFLNNTVDSRRWGKMPPPPIFPRQCLELRTPLCPISGGHAETVSSSRKCNRWHHSCLQ